MVKAELVARFAFALALATSACETGSTHEASVEPPGGEAREGSELDEAPPIVGPPVELESTPEAVAELEMRRTQTGHLLVPLELEGRSFEFILDTGASISVITPETRDRLGFDEKAGESVQAAGANGEIGGVRLLELSGLEIARRRYAPLHFAVMSLAHLEAPLGSALPGILGQNFLSLHHLELDFAAGRMRLHPRDRQAPRLEGAVAVPFDNFEIAPLIRIEVAIDGHAPFPAVLDLGAGRSILNAAAVRALGLDPDDPALPRVEPPLLGADNQPLELRAQDFEELRIGELSIEAPHLYIGDIGIFESLGVADTPAMVFGVDLLEGRRLVIDYESRRLQVAAAD